jgi:hypothetical protein
MDEGPPVKFEANGHKYNYDYYLVGDIYPKWCTCVKPVVNPKGKKQLYFIMHKWRLRKIWREH